MPLFCGKYAAKINILCVSREMKAQLFCTVREGNAFFTTKRRQKRPFYCYFCRITARTGTVCHNGVPTAFMSFAP